MNLAHTKTSFRSFVSTKQRVTALFTAALLLLQIILPAAAAATLISNESVGAAMQQPQFQLSKNSNYLYEQAIFDDSQYLASPNIASFHAALRTAKINVGKPKYVPIAGDITFFVPTYPVGKLLGDSYVQARFIRQQIINSLGRHLIDSATDLGDENKQIKRLYDNAFNFAQNFQATYVYGDNLPAALSIPQDMIWPELRTINGVQVMVPILYLTTASINAFAVNDHRVEFKGSTASFKTISLDHVSLVTGLDTVINVQSMVLTGGNFSVTGALNLVVGGTLELIGSSITATKNISIIAAQFIAKTLVQPFTDRYGSGTRLGRVSNVSGTSVSIVSGGDILLEGAKLTATDGKISLQAAGSIFIKPVYTSYKGEYKDGVWQVSSSSLDVFGSRLTAKDQITLIAKGGIEISASELISTEGGIELLAEQGILILDELTQEQIQKVDRKGKTTGQSSEFRTEAVRSILKAGKGVLLDSAYGDVVLKATEITSTEGAQVNAKNGKVNLLMTKELEEYHLQTVKKSTWTIKTRTEDVIHENNIQNAIVGGLQVQAKYGINVEYTGKEGSTVRQQIEEFRTIPEMEWMAKLYDKALLDAAAAGKSINWNEIEEVHEEIKKTKRNLSPAAMAIIAIAVCVAMGPVGAQVVGSSSGGLSAFIASSVSNATLGAALSAGAVTLTTQAVQSLAAGNNLRETLNAMDSSESLKSLAVSMVTAGAMQHTDFEVFEAVKGDSLGMSLARQSGQAVIDSTVKAGISVAIYGGNSSDYLNAFKANIASYAADKLGEKMAKKIGDAYHNKDISNLVRYLGHAGSGCVYGVASAAANSSPNSEKYSCFSGATGAVIGEFTADQFKANQGLDAKQKATEEWLARNGIDENTDYEAMTPEQKDLMRQTMPANFISLNELRELQAVGVDLAKLGAGLAAFIAEADVNIASSSGGVAAENNALPLLVYVGMLALNAIAFYMVVQDTVEFGEKLSDPALTEQQKMDVVVEYSRAMGIDAAIILAGGGALKGLAKLIDILKAEKKVSSDVIDELEKIEELVGSGKKYVIDDQNIVVKKLIGTDFEEYLSKMLGGKGGFSVGGRDFDGGIGNRWWEAKSGNYWTEHCQLGSGFEKFKSDMGARLSIAKNNGASYELHSNAPIPDYAKNWLATKGIPYFEH